MPGHDHVAERGLPDETLMERYAGGDSAAFDELFQRYEGRAYAYFARRTHSGDRARDLYQELFLRLHRARETYDSARPFAPWFFQIAHRLFVDDERRAHRSQEVPFGAHEPTAPGAHSGDPLADREELARLLAPLSADERYVLVCAKVEGIGYRELAAELGRSVEAVRQLASRAMRRLRIGPQQTALELPSRGR